MWPESKEPKKGKKTELRTGLTTGCCATACCVAAANALFSHKYDNLKVSVTLPSRKKKLTESEAKVVELLITELKKEGDQVRACTIKDAGDDPDVTHGAKVWVSINKVNEPGIRFIAGEGVGTVTREGLSLSVGEPAINPVPRAMITEHLDHISSEYGYQEGFQVTIGIEHGEALALKTMNPRLGILGGLSVLGTSGIVRPFSCSAYIASIHQGVDVALANGITHLSASTGNLSEQAIQNRYGLTNMAMIEMGDFIGALLKHIKARNKQNKSVPEKLSICAGFGKLTKLAAGNMDLHSRASSINFSDLSCWASELGASEALNTNILSANTSIEVLNLCKGESLDLAALVCHKAKSIVKNVSPSELEIEVFAIDRKGNFIGSSHESF